MVFISTTGHFLDNINTSRDFDRACLGEDFELKQDFSYMMTFYKYIKIQGYTYIF